MTAPTTDGLPPAGFRLGLTPGMVPTSWTRTWSERLPGHPLELVQLTSAEAADALVEGTVDAALLRLPVDRTHLHAIPLYSEVTVLVLPKDHLLTALDEVSPEDLVEETLIVPADDVLRWVDPPGERSLLPTPPTTADAVELVASGVGVLAVPMSLARLHHRKDLTYRPLTDAPTSQAALGWTRAREDDPLIEELIGIIRGRTANSSRGRARTEPTPQTPRATKAGQPTRQPARRKGGATPARRGGTRTRRGR